MKPSRTESVRIHDLRYEVRHWGAPEAPTVFFLHGWMDASATFQFLVDSLKQEWHVIAPDWRGYGASQWLRRPYSFPDYYLDLDKLLDHYSPEKPARLVGHSMGGSIASVYASVKPERVTQLAVLDFLGLTPLPEVNTSGQILRWMNAASGSPRMSSYADYAELAQRMRQGNRRLNAKRADFLAQNIGRLRADGRVELAFDPWHKIPSPFIYRVEDTMACWRLIRAPTLLLIADQGHVAENVLLTSEEYRRRIECFPRPLVGLIEDSGHNLQHDQPEQVASWLEDFLVPD